MKNINNSNPPKDPTSNFSINNLDDFLKNAKESNILDGFIKNANDMEQLLKPHLFLENKVSIWLNIANKIFPTLKNFLILILSSLYFTKNVIFEDVTHKIVDFILENANDYWILLIICITIVASLFIKKKYK
ncbi:MAG: hypothetical protein LW595_02270 [Rickettsiales bacterium]|jgi:hypothetical protein|nr:hypothetical protein [Rickettsiales bacterium]